MIFAKTSFEVVLDYFYRGDKEDKFLWGFCSDFMMRLKWKRVSPRGSKPVDCREQLSKARVYGVFIPSYGAIEWLSNRRAPQVFVRSRNGSFWSYLFRRLVPKRSCVDIPRDQSLDLALYYMTIHVIMQAWCKSDFEYWANRVGPRPSAFRLFAFPSSVQFQFFKLFYIAFLSSFPQLPG